MVQATTNHMTAQTHHAGNTTTYTIHPQATQQQQHITVHPQAIHTVNKRQQPQPQQLHIQQQQPQLVQVEVTTAAPTAAATTGRGSANKKAAFTCGQCGLRFTKRLELTDHCLLVHTNERRFACDLCEKSFSRKSLLTAHRRVHTGEQPYACGQCDRRFNRSDDLARHMRLHGGERPFACDQCDKKYFVKVDLRRHMKVHENAAAHAAAGGGGPGGAPMPTEKRQFACDQCGLRFDKSTELTAHRMAHTGEPLFVCDHCPKKFISKGYLDRHVSVMHADLMQQ